MKMNKWKIFLLAGTLGIAVTTSNPVSAATTTMTTTSSQKAAIQAQIRADRHQAALQQKQLNEQFHQQHKALVTQLRGASAEQKTTIRQELKQLNLDHRAQIRAVQQTLRAQIRSLQQENKAARNTAK